MGEDTLVEDVFFDSFRADADTEELLAAFRLSVETGPDVLFAARRYARVFVRRAELDGFERLLAEVRPKYLDGTDERRAAFEAWAGRFYKELHAPDAFLALAGDRARDWESGSTPGSAPGYGRSGRTPCARRSVTQRRGHRGAGAGAAGTG